MKPEELPTVVSMKEQPHVMGGRMAEKMVDNRKPMSPAKKRKMQLKYIRYRHLYLSQQAVRRAPSRAKKLKPMRTP